MIFAMNKNTWTLIALGLGILIASACTTRQHQEIQTDIQFMDSIYLARGKEVTDLLFSKLSSEVSTRMQRDGLEKTLDYCKMNAYPITDSLATLFNVSIKRTSHKIRSHLNSPDTLEREILNQYLSQQEKKIVLEPVIVSSFQGKIRFFAPIYLAGPCAKCHGDIQQDIKEDNYTFLKKRYPNDQAVGFSAGDLRGIWSVSFKE